MLTSTYMFTMSKPWLSIKPSTGPPSGVKDVDGGAFRKSSSMRSKVTDVLVCSSKVKTLSASQNGNEEQQEKLLREWLDCCVTEGGVLVAMQKSSRRRNHPLVTQMMEKWLDRYRQLRPCASLSDGEEEDDEDE